MRLSPSGITYCGFDTLGGQFRVWGFVGVLWDFVAAATGAVVGECIATPMDVWKNSAIQRQDIPTGRVPRWIWTHDGALGFFKGLVPAALRKSMSNGGMPCRCGTRPALAA